LAKSDKTRQVGQWTTLMDNSCRQPSQEECIRKEKHHVSRITCGSVDSNSGVIGICYNTMIIFNVHYILKNSQLSLLPFNINLHWNQTCITLFPSTVLQTS